MCRLEIKRTSITRLKLALASRAEARKHTVTWNQKNLDYEIETGYIYNILPYIALTWNQKNLDYEIETVILTVFPAASVMRLKSKEPRLRDWNQNIIRWYDLFDVSKTWNQKNLDYEIETILVFFACPLHHRLPWNQKNLDYEIETANG